MYSPADTAVRMGKSLAVHIVFGLLICLLAFLLLGSFDAASDLLREQYEEPEVLRLLADARARFVGWATASLAMSWVFSSAFLWIANLRRRGVRHGVDERKVLPWWIALFVVAIGTTALQWWRMVSQTDVAAMLASADYLLLVTTVTIGQPLAFWAATGLAVALTLKPSVPLAETLLPTQVWN